MDTAGDAEDLLDEELWESILIISGGLANISLRRSIDNISNSETLDSFVLANASTAVSASDILHVTTAMLGSTVVSTFYGHIDRN